MELVVKDKDGNTVGTTDADDSVWCAPFNEALLHQVAIAQLANKRLGTHSTLTRSQVRQSKRKIRNQKHSGRSRQGSIKAPHHRGGGVAHGPSPRSYTQKVHKKMTRQALRIALSIKLREEKVSVVDVLELKEPKTKAITSLISNFALTGSALIVTNGKNEMVYKSARNLQKVNVLPANQLNPLDIVRIKDLLLTRAAVETVNTMWGKSEKSTPAEQLEQEEV